VCIKLLIRQINLLTLPLYFIFFQTFVHNVLSQLAEVLSFLNVFIGSRTLIIISKENPQLTTIFKNDLYFKKI